MEKIVVSADGVQAKEMSEKPKYLKELDDGKLEEFINSFDTIFTDCDGVLWLENEVIQDSNSALNRLRELGKTVFYITNNSTKTREEFVTKCTKLGFAAKWDNIISSAYLAGEYLKGIDFDKKVYVVGSPGIVKELDRFGIRHTEIGPDIIDPDLECYVTTKYSLDPEVGAVLVGFDEHFSFPKMLKACNYLKKQDCLFVATNADENLSIGDLLIPGTGSIVQCLETATRRKAFVIGKPNEYIKEAVNKHYALEPSRTLMIGDRCNTDILFGRRCGFQTLLVLSGVTSHEELMQFSSSKNPSERELVPQYYIDKLGDLLPYLS